MLESWLLVYSLEISKSWKWEEKSIIHREKFINLREYGQVHPQKIKVINNVNVCFLNEFLIGIEEVMRREFMLV